jgi:hypothetical protein
MKDVSFFLKAHLDGPAPLHVHARATRQSSALILFFRSLQPFAFAVLANNWPQVMAARDMGQ